MSRSFMWRPSAPLLSVEGSVNLETWRLICDHNGRSDDRANKIVLDETWREWLVGVRAGASRSAALGDLFKEAWDLIDALDKHGAIEITEQH